AHSDFKQKVLQSGEGDTILTLKQLTPVRLIKNQFYDSVNQAEMKGASKDELLNLLGKRRSRLGIFEGNLEEGELEIGQVAASLTEIQPAATILREIWDEYNSLK